MAEIIIDYSKMGGLILAGGSTNGFLVQCDNFDASVDNNGDTIYHGFLTKRPLASAYGDTIANQASLGIYYFLSYENKIPLQGFTDGTIRYLVGGVTWTSIKSGLSGTPVDFEGYLGLDRIFFTDGVANVWKWANGWTAPVALQDKDGTTPTAITGTLTFTVNVSTVTGGGTSFLTACPAGTYIRRASTEYWYEVKSVESDTSLTLTTAFFETTGAGASGGSQKAMQTVDRGRFLKVWKDRLYVASISSGNLFIVGTDKTDDIEKRIA